jgi:hypothetical protein
MGLALFREKTLVCLSRWMPGKQHTRHAKFFVSIWCLAGEDLPSDHGIQNLPTSHLRLCPALHWVSLLAE